MGVELIKPGPKTSLMPLYYEGHFLRESMSHPTLPPWTSNGIRTHALGCHMTLRYAHPQHGGQVLAKCPPLVASLPLPSYHLERPTAKCPLHIPTQPVKIVHRNLGGPSPLKSAHSRMVHHHTPGCTYTMSTRPRARCQTQPACQT